MSCSIANPNETRTAIYVDGVADYASKVYDIEPGKSKYGKLGSLWTAWGSNSSHIISPTSGT